MLTYVLKPKPPFRLDLAVWTLRRRSENAVDAWDGAVWRRVLPTPSGPVLLEVQQVADDPSPRLSVRLQGANSGPATRRVATASIERLLGIRRDLQPFYDLAAQHPRVHELAQRFRGMKPPRFLSSFECLTNAVACQQISLAAGIQLLNRFAAAFGQSVQTDSGQQFAFPRPADLAHADVQQLRQLGFSRNKGKALLELAELHRSDRFDLDRCDRLSDSEAVQALLQLRGVGRWTAEYALLRGLSRIHIFPGDDVGARNNLQGWLKLSEDLNYERVRTLLHRWQPFAGLIYFHLLLDKLQSQNHLQASRRP